MRINNILWERRALKVTALSSWAGPGVPMGRKSN